MSGKDDLWKSIEADVDAEYPWLHLDVRRRITAGVVARVESPAFKEEVRRQIKEMLIKKGIFDRIASEHPEWFDSLLPDGPQAPRWAGVVLTAFAKSPAAAEAAVGCMHERFARDCAKYGVGHATLYCWAEATRSLLPLLRRAIGRAVKWAAIISAVKRYLVG